VGGVRRLAAGPALLAAALGLAACAGPRGPEPAPGGELYHTVKPGETAWRISRRYGVSVEALLAANGIEDVGHVPAGARLRIPAGRERAALPAPPEPGGGDLGLAWPVAGRLSSRFGPRRRGHHDGIDLSARRGTPVRAAAPGRVIYSGDGLADYGNVVILKHVGRYSTVYAHNRRNLVARGDFVERGQPIAEVGSSGNARGAHLHFEVREDARPRDPLRYLPVLLVRRP
jgi:murein DD-endopeptidase MepM/ murein hydrolase activator NlpD